MSPHGAEGSEGPESHLVKRTAFVMVHAALWLDLKDILLTEINQTTKDKYCTVHSHEVLNVVTFIDTENGMEMARGCWRGPGEVITECMGLQLGKVGSSGDGWWS